MTRKVTDLSFTKKLSRRSVLKGAAAAAAIGTVGGSFPMPAIAQETTWTLANSLRSVANPYHATFAKGGEDFAKSIGAKYEVLVTEGNSEKGIADIRVIPFARCIGIPVIRVIVRTTRYQVTFQKVVKRNGRILSPGYICV